MGPIEPLPIDVIKQITNTYDSLSKSQQKVVEFMLDKGLEALYMTSSEIAEAVALNRSTVVRTAQALGYEGFSELQTALQEYFSQQFAPREWLDIGRRDLMESLEEVGESDSHSILRQMVQIETQKLVSLPDLINQEDFNRAVELLSGARSVNLMGIQLSNSVAMNFFYPLNLIRGECYLLTTETTPLIRRLSQLNQADVFFAISNYPYARITLQCIKHARSVGAAIIALTDSHVSPVAKHSDITFVIPSRLWFYANSVVPFTLVNALSAAVLKRTPDSLTEEREQVKKAYKNLQIFLEDDE